MRSIDAAFVLVFTWMAIVIVLGGRLAWDLGIEPIFQGLGRQMFLAAGLVYAFCLGSTLISWRLRSSMTFAVAMAAAAVVVMVAALTTGSVLALAVVVAVAGVAWLVGEALIGGIIAAYAPFAARAVVSFALGNGLLGLLFLLLGSFDRLDAAGVAISLAALTIASVALVRHRSKEWRLLRRPVAPATLWEAVLVGLASGIVAFALLSSFMPETISDAVRAHLPVVRQIWQTASTSGSMWQTANLPIHAQLVSIAGWAAGGDIGVKLSHAVVGLVTVAGVGTLGWLLAGRTAAVLAGVIFATIPIVLWELGRAYVDLYPALFGTSSAIVILVWQQTARRSLLVVGGALAAFAFAAKVIAGSAVAALGIALGLVGRARWRLSERVEAVVLYVLGGMAILPWLAWSYQKTGAIPGLDYALSALFDRTAPMLSSLPTFGLGHDLGSLLTIPWAATFQGERFNEAGAGNLGLLPLVVLPAVLFAPRTRATAFVAVAALTAYGGWAFSAQYLRYSLPLLALACALLGAGLAGLIARISTAGLVRRGHVLFGVLTLGLVITPVLTMNNWIFRMPPGYFTGQMSREELLAQYVLGYRVFDRSSAIVGAGNPLPWIGVFGTPTIYSEAAVIEMVAPPVGSSDAEVLAELETRGATHFAWERTGADPSAWRSPMLSMEFLRRYTAPVYAADNTYLFEVYKEPGDRWGFGIESIVSATPGQSPEGSGWQNVGDVTTSGTSTIVRPNASINHEAPVVNGTPYLLVAHAHCPGADDRLIMVLNWIGDEGPISMEWQLLAPGQEPSEQFVWAVAPETATSVVAQVSAWGTGICIIDDVTLHEGERHAG